MLVNYNRAIIHQIALCHSTENEMSRISIINISERRGAVGKLNKGRVLAGNAEEIIFSQTLTAYESSMQLAA